MGGLAGIATIANGGEAANFFTPEEASGAVGLVMGHIGNGFYLPYCTGTLIGGSQIFTSAACTRQWNPALSQYEDIPAGALVVKFQQDDSPSRHHFVVEIERLAGPEFNEFGRDIALLHLEAPVPEAVVKNPAPAFLGDVGAALASGRLDANDAFLVGHGPNCEYNSDCGVEGQDRSFGRVSSPVQLAWEDDGFNPYLRAQLSTADGVVPTIGNPSSDHAASLFVWDTVARRYTLVGASVSRRRDGAGYHHFSITGSAGNNPDNDTGSWLRQRIGPDGDEDGIPDVFDNCPPAMCEEASECANPLQENGQLDRLGDKCDPCGAADADPAGRNSNALVELDLGAEARSDRCDPVPLLRFHRQGATVEVGLGTQSSDASEEGPEEVYKFSASTWAGIGGYGRTFDDDVAFRYCPCWNSRSGAYEQDTAVCAASICPPGQAFEAFGDWKKPILSYVLPNGAHWGVHPDTGMGVPSAFEEDREGAPADFVFRWYDLIVTGEVEPEQLTIEGEEFHGTRGFLASAVLDESGYRSLRDETYEGRLRVDLEHHAFPKVVVLPGFQREWVAGCNHPGCFAWAMPWDEWRFQVNERLDWLVRPGVLRGDPTTVELLRGDASFDVTVATTGWIGRLVSGEAGPWSFASAVESGQRLRAAGATGRAALLPTSHSEAVRPVMITGGETLAVDAELRGEPWSSLFVPAGAGPLRLEAFDAAAFSGLEGAVYLVGEGYGGQIVRYDLTSEAADFFSAGDAPGDRVLAATYDSTAGRLYLLDVFGDEVRVVRHGLQDGTAKTLWTAPFAELHARYALHRLDDGRLVITAGGADGFSSWMARVAAGELQFEGHYASSLPLLDLPVMGEFHPIAPVLRDGALDYVDLTPGLFQGVGGVESL